MNATYLKIWVKTKSIDVKINIGYTSGTKAFRGFKNNEEMPIY